MVPFLKSCIYKGIWKLKHHIRFFKKLLLDIRLKKITIVDHDIKNIFSKKEEQKEEDIIITLQVHWRADGVTSEGQR